MATLVSPDMFGPGPFGTHAYAASMAGDGTANSSSLRRPSSPPQPVPRPRPRHFAVLSPVDSHPSLSSSSSGGAEWEDPDAPLLVAASPAASDGTEQFLDCYSDIPSAASSFCEAECSGLSMEDTSRLSTHSQLPAATASSSGAWQLELEQERHRREVAEAAAAELQQQLNEISATLFGWRSSTSSRSTATSSTGSQSGSGSSSSQQHQQQQQNGSFGCSEVATAAAATAASSSPAAALQAVLQGAAAQCLESAQQAAAAEQRAAAAEARAAEAAASAADAALVARLVSAMFASAAAASDLGAQWQAEQAVLERRLEQAARMQQAMLKHQREHRSEPEPWRQQLLNTAVSVGCSILGAATAVLIIRRTQA